jgi:hypothetical protein
LGLKVLASLQRKPEPPATSLEELSRRKHEVTA